MEELIIKTRLEIEENKFLKQLDKEFKINLSPNIETKVVEKEVKKVKDKIEKDKIDLGVNNKKAIQEVKEVEKVAEKSAKSIKGAFSDVLSGFGIGAGLFTAQAALQGIATAATQAFNSYKQFDSAVQNIATLGVVDDLDGLKNVLNEVSKTTVDDASVLASATYQALSAGVKGSNEELGKFIQTASKVATAGGSDAETAVDALTTVMNAFGLSTKDADLISDQFFGTIKAGKTSFPELSASLSSVAGAAASAGISFGEVGASVATLTAQGIPTAQATTKIRSAIVALQKPNADTTKLFKQMGLSVNDVADILKKPVEEGGGLTNFLNQLQKEAEKSGKNFTQLFSSVEASSAALALTGANAELAFGNLEDVIKNSAGSAEFAYDEASSSIENQLGLIAGSIQATFNSVFIKLEPIIKGFLSGFGQAFDFVADVLSDVGEIVGDVLEPVFDTFGVLIDEVNGYFKNLFGEVSEGGNTLKVIKDVIVNVIQVALIPLRISFQVLSKIVQTLIKVYIGLANQFVNIAKAVSEFVKNNQILNAVFTKIGEAVSFLIDKLKSLLSALGLWSDTSKKIEKENEKVIESSEGITEAFEENTQAVQDLDKAGKSLTTNELVEKLAKLRIAGKENTKEFQALFEKTKNLVLADKELNDTIKKLNDEFLGVTKSSEEFTNLVSNLAEKTSDIRFEIETENIKRSTAEVGKFVKENLNLGKIIERTYVDSTAFINKFYDDYEEKIKENQKLLLEQESVDANVRVRQLQAKQVKELKTIEDGNKKELSKYKQGSEEYILIQEQQNELIVALKEKQALELQNLEIDNAKKLIEITDRTNQQIKESEEERLKTLNDINEVYKNETIKSINDIGGEYSSNFAKISESVFTLNSLIENGTKNWEDYGAVAGSVLSEISQLVGENTKLGKALGITSAIVNTAVAVTKALQLPFPLNIIQSGLIGSLGALQIAKIRGAESGVIGIDDNYKGKVGKTDTIPLMVAKGESIISKKGTMNNKAFLDYANKGGYIGDLIDNTALIKQHQETNYRLERLENALLTNKFQNVKLLVENKANVSVSLGGVRV